MNFSRSYKLSRPFVVILTTIITLIVLLFLLIFVIGPLTYHPPEQSLISKQSEAENFYKYQNNEATISFLYPANWGYIQTSYFERGQLFSGKHWIIRFKNSENILSSNTPLDIYIESTDRVVYATQDDWGIVGNEVDLDQEDEDIAKILKSPNAEQVTIERKSFSGKRGLIADERGIDSVTRRSYHHVYFFIPRYNESEDLSLFIPLINPTEEDRLIIENLLNNIEFSIKEPNEMFLLKEPIFYKRLGKNFIKGNRAEWYSRNTVDKNNLIRLGICTKETYENSSCMPNGFYLYDTGEVIDLQMADDVLVDILLPSMDGSVSDREILSQPSSDEFYFGSPFLVTVGLLDGEVILVKERYVP